MKGIDVKYSSSCVRGYDAWCYETNRYYGDDGLVRVPVSGYISRETEVVVS